jgi:S-formylglutathione hydrolase
MLRHSRIAALLLLLAMPVAATAQTGSVVSEKVTSPALQGNPLGDSATREVLIYLPASYAKATTVRFPVVYLLHGYTGNAQMWQGDYVNLPQIADIVMAGGKVAEMIIVMPDGSNSYRGSFYVNSAATGNWEEFITRDLVQFIDKKYRTIATRDGRGIAGHSMGGYGAMSLAMKHPDVFAAVYGLSPCCLVWGQDFSLSNPAWQRTLTYKSPAEIKDGPFFAQAFLALAGAWSPNPQKPPPTFRCRTRTGGSVRWSRCAPSGLRSCWCPWRSDIWTGWVSCAPSRSMWARARSSSTSWQGARRWMRC